MKRERGTPPSKNIAKFEINISKLSNILLLQYRWDFSVPINNLRYSENLKYPVKNFSITQKIKAKFWLDYKCIRRIEYFWTFSKSFRT